MPEQKILVVDDEPVIRAVLCRALSAPGFSVFEADCGKAALSLAAQQAPFALVVSDVLMPGMDGFELATKLNAAGNAQRFLFVSGYCDGHSMQKRISEFPISAFLAKPFSISELLHAFRALLGQEPAAVRVAAVRENRAPITLRCPSTPIDSIRALRRKTRGLQARRNALLEDARWGLRTNALLWWQIESHCAAIQAIQRRLTGHRAKL